MGPLKVSEVFCYICRGILIEPVTLPCLHVFCLSCFDQSMAETSYTCPLCRRRISNWVRSVKKGNNLVNDKLWKQIKEEFKEQVWLKLNGEDDGLDQRLQTEYSVFASTSKPGEVAEEFTKLLNEFNMERERLKQAEELASKELIVKLKEEEEQQLKILEENKMLRLQEDSLLAIKVQKELNKEITTNNTTITTNSDSNRGIAKNMTNKKKGVEKGPAKGPIDGFLIERAFSKTPETETTMPNQQEEEDRSTSADSTDSIRLEMNLFKPIKKVRTTPPKLYPDGRMLEINLTKVTPLKLTFPDVPLSSSSRIIVEGKNIHSKHSAFVDANTPTLDDFESPPKRLKTLPDDVLKDITLGENTDSNSSTVAPDDSIKKKGKKLCQDNFTLASKISKFSLEEKDNENDNFETQDYLNLDNSIEESLIEEQRRIEKIILQEKEDRKLALKLSREWESETKQKPLTRSMHRSTKNRSCKKMQQTLIESIANRTRNKQK